MERNVSSVGDANGGIIEKQEDQSLCLVLVEDSTQSSHQMIDFLHFKFMLELTGCI